MTEIREPLLWDQLPLKPLRPIPFWAHIGAIFADSIVAFVAAIAVAGVFDLGVFVVPRLSHTPQVVWDFTIWMLLTLYTLLEAIIAVSPGKWFADVVIRAARGAPAARWRLTVRWAIKCSPLLLIDVEAALRLLNWLLDRDYPAITLRNRTQLQQIAIDAVYAVTIGCLLAILPSRRMFHDWVAGTAVFHRFEVNVAEPPPTERGFEVCPAPSTIEIASATEPAAPATVDDDGLAKGES